MRGNSASSGRKARKTLADTGKGMAGPEDYATFRKWRYLEIRLFRALKEACRTRV